MQPRQLHPCLFYKVVQCITGVWWQILICALVQIISAKEVLKSDFNTSFDINSYVAFTALKPLIYEFIDHFYDNAMSVAILKK